VCTGPDRILGPATDTAPAARLALGKRVDHPVHRPVRTTNRGRDDQTLPKGPKKNQWNTTDSGIAGSAGSSHTTNQRLKPDVPASSSPSVGRG